MIHAMSLRPEPFEAIENETKKIEYRLWDEKRSKLKVGDRIFFTNIENDKQLEVRVVGIYRANTFTELRTALMAKGLIGFNEFEPAKMAKYYSKDDEYRYGVVGVVIALIKDEDKEGDKYIERFEEPAFMTVAEYAISSAVKEKCAEGGRLCVNAVLADEKAVSRKIRRIFTEDAIKAMAYYIKFLDNDLSEEELKNEVSQFSYFKQNDVKNLLECVSGLSFRKYDERNENRR